MKTNYTKKGRVLCLLTAVFMCLSGCENAGNPDTGQEHIARENAGQTVCESAGQTVGESAGQTVRENAGQTVDWNSHRITSAAKEEDGSQWYLRESFDSWITLPEAYSWKSSSFYNSPDGDFCALTQYALYNEDGSFSKAWNCLDYFDTETADSLHTEISPDAWGLPKTANLALADVVGDRLVACYFYTTEETGTPRSYCSVVFYHMENGVQKTLDLLPALTAAGMVDNIAPFSEKNILCDQNGCCYIVLEDKLLIVGDTGQLLLLEEPQNDAAPLSYLCRTPEGLPVFVSQDLKSRSNAYWILTRTPEKCALWANPAICHCPVAVWIPTGISITLPPWEYWSDGIPCPGDRKIFLTAGPTVYAATWRLKSSWRFRQMATYLFWTL